MEYGDEVLEKLVYLLWGEGKGGANETRLIVVRLTHLYFFFFNLFFSPVSVRQADRRSNYVKNVLANTVT